MTAPPRTPRRSASAVASRIQPSTSSRSMARSAGGGWTTRMPPAPGMDRCAAIAAAAASGPSTRWGNAEAGGRAVEGGQLIGPVPDHRHATRLEQFQRRRQVEDRLGARAHDGNRRGGQLVDVARDVEARRGAPVHATDAAGGEHRDAGQVCRAHRGAHRRRGEGPRGEQRPEVARAGLRHRPVRIGQPLEQGVVGTDDDAAVLDGDGRRDRAGLADRGLGRQGRLQVVRDGQALRDEARLEGDDTTPGIERLTDLVGDHEEARRHAGPSAGTRPCAPGTRATAAARSAADAIARSSRPASGGQSASARSAINPALNASPAPVASTAGPPLVAARSQPTPRRETRPRRPGG